MNRTNSKKPSNPKISFLPRDAVEFLRKNEKCENNYLLFSRFGRYQVNEKNNKKEVMVEPLSDPLSHNKFSTSLITEILQSLGQRQEWIVSQFPDYLKLQYKVNGRLLLGIGGGTPYTTTNPMKLHPLYGIPYIPGSSLKGSIRNCWLHEHLTGHSLPLGSKNLKDYFDICFGTGTDEEQTTSGKLIFLDAYPVEEYKIVRDVLTPHYKTYYNQKGASPPRDDDFPNIISLPAIEDTVFTIYIGINFKTSELDGDLRDQIIQTILSTFSEYGIGAKTAVGYGLGKVTLCSS
ncbi:type III-B CRISPR module RAMP protein Cmr6 [Paenibacillus doosanensis]|uniref:type III-B CRISPR module RAMP protein Cmr6 n=1 Tax=Paenibacillus doosanensis TaxID=1229154 RepID=UPI00217FB711|nr:type III-B CRISPR module RAMP protein Cmr6 [Paenibacillus doosanensis]MCS7459005.1 type III-B CRISPR module RAMP protein Cmr6 [Paenibacillus doosanensis]